jgi:hypothetical protein
LRSQIWYTRSPQDKTAWQDFENVIVLSEEFYKEVVAHPIRTDLEAVKVLSGAPAALDLFMWVVLSLLRFQGRIDPAVWAVGLASQLGSVEYSRLAVSER